jgi:ABC-type polysaccharide/polyol phosphate transport system ATPase subunit
MTGPDGAPDPGAVLTLSGVTRRFAVAGPSRRAWSRRVLGALLGRAPPPPPLSGGATVTALAGVSLSLRRGEALGVIGRNGAGKTTLLRLAAGHLTPDAGGLQRKGRTVALTDLTGGFSPALTGHETIPVVAGLMGLGRAEIAAVRPAIERFCGLDAATLARPVGGYSSGEALRLGFAIAAHAAPDLLLVDEVLSVGDFPFRQRCLSHMMTLKERAGVVLVSHNLAEVARFCDRVAVLAHGRLVFLGETEAGLAHYRRLLETEADASPAPEEDHAAPPFLAPLFLDDDRVSALELAWLDEQGQPTDARPFGAPLILRLSVRLCAPAAALSVGVPVFSSDGVRITALASDLDRPARPVPAGARLTVSLTLPAPRLNPGLWHAVAALHDGPGTLARRPAPPLRVTGGPSRHWGAVTPEARWDIAPG